MLTFLNWLFIILTVLAALIQYLKEGTKKNQGEGSRNTKYSRLLIVILSIATLASFYLDSLERNRDLERILESIQRSLDKIEDASVSFQGTVPASDPDVAEFRRRIIDDPACLEKNNGLSSSPITPACLVFLRKDQNAYGRLGTVDIRLDFHRDPMDADLSLGFAGNLVEGDLSLSYDAVEDRFVLSTIKALTPYALEAPGDILSIDDLKNTVLEIRVRSTEQSADSVTERLTFESIDIKLKGAHTWYKHVSRADTKQVKNPLRPVFRYRIRD